jgi:hypothetical protein
MSNLRQYKRTLNLMALLGLLGVAMSLSAQAPTSRSDADQITGLMAALSDHSKAPSGVLDPNLSPSDRSKNLNRLSAPNYQLSLVPEGAPAITGDSATVPVRVHFDDKNGNTLSSTAHFVKLGGTWYFANFNFMKWPGFLVAVLVIGILVGIAYAVTVLVLWRKLISQGQLGANAVKMFPPIFWPSLFRLAH